MEKSYVQNIAYFDGEFTAAEEKDRGIQELIQCSMIIQPAEFGEDRKLISLGEPIAVYNTFVQPKYTKTLSEYIKQLTGIRQEDVDGGISIYSVLSELHKLISHYQVKRIFTWGPDRNMLAYNFNVANCDKRKAKSFCKKILDISPFVSDFCGYGIVLSQHKACQLLQVEETGQHHNSYDDVVNLSKIIKEFRGQILP